MFTYLLRASQSAGEIKRREVSWTLTKTISKRCDSNNNKRTEQLGSCFFVVVVAVAGDFFYFYYVLSWTKKDILLSNVHIQQSVRYTHGKNDIAAPKHSDIGRVPYPKIRSWRRGPIHTRPWLGSATKSDFPSRRRMLVLIQGAVFPPKDSPGETIHSAKQKCRWLIYQVWK